MAGARAAASLSLTIGVAFATVLVMGGILAGPAILDCSHTPQKFGACLRDRLDHSRLLPAPDQPSQVPVLSSESAPPSLPTHEAETEHPDNGWIDARANEYAPPPLTVASGDLAAAPSLLGEGSLVPSPEITGSIGRRPGTDGAVAIVAALEPVVPMPRPKPLPAPKPNGKPKAEVKKPAPKPVRLAKAGPRLRTFTNDPRFPNVTVLPPPRTGANSSIVTLETR